MATLVHQVFASPLARLAAKFNAVNLGQGFPTFPVPDFIRNAASTAVQSPNALNQYTRSEGHVRLVQALSKFYEPKYGRKIDTMKGELRKEADHSIASWW
jgi:kynurenine--oxoglutarate transaminase/cysteine-S-conjugate beta-lyase/glutamine--phenylpyruvate transaminase